MELVDSGGAGEFGSDDPVNRTGNNDFSNNVWAILNKGFDAAIARNNRPPSVIVQAPQTQASPNMTPGWNVFNPFPGMFRSGYPQAEGKGADVSSSSILTSLPMIFIIGGALLLIVALIRR